MNKKYNYIKTTFPDTAKQLIDLGFEFHKKAGNTYVFLNKGNEHDYYRRK